MNGEYDLKCNICGGNMQHFEHNGTFIWVCEECPNVQFEFYTNTDYIELGDYLKNGN